MTGSEAAATKPRPAVISNLVSGTKFLFGLMLHLCLKKSSIFKSISFAICFNKIGEISRPLWKGTVVNLPSECLNCLWEPFCLASWNPRFSRILTTSVGFNTGIFDIVIQRLFEYRQIHFQILLNPLQAAFQLLPLSFY